MNVQGQTGILATGAAAMSSILTIVIVFMTTFVLVFGYLTTTKQDDMPAEVAAATLDQSAR
jgi:hypothetical protein